MRPQQESPDGIFIFSLCERCNNKTGARYGADYVSFVRLIGEHALEKNVNQDVSISFEGLHPLRIVKQATSMLLSTSEPTDFSNHEFVGAPGRSKRDLHGIDIRYPDKNHQQAVYEQLRRFVRQRDSNDFPDGVGIYLFASVGKRVGFRTGIFSSIDLSSRSVVFAAATGLWPVHWVFTLGSELHKEILEVTEWTNYGYKDTFSNPVPVPMRWLEGHYPLDFRSPQDLLAYNFVHSMELEGFVPSTIEDKETLLEEALLFARTLAKRTAKGYLVSAFSTGTFYEYNEVNGWLPDGNEDAAIAVLEHRLGIHDATPNQ
jgi:hypothetical protein